MKLLVDMNLSPAWAAFLSNAGWQAVHCSKLDVPLLKDTEVLLWARRQSYVLFTHDLDFGAALALAGKGGPSIFQVTAADVMPVKIGAPVVRTLRELEPLLEQGAIVLVDLASGKARVFRINKSQLQEGD